MTRQGAATSRDTTPGRITPDWLVARPIAHRGFHNKARGVIENSPSAAEAAIARGFAIECDVQITADGEAMVFHDEALARLALTEGAMRDIKAEDARRLRLGGSSDNVPTLGDFLAQIAGRTPLIIEIKSNFDGDMALLQRVAAVIATYDGPVAIKSFDPDIVGEAATLCPGVPRGIVAQSTYDYAEWTELPRARVHDLANLLHVPHSRPDFVSWRVSDLPCAAPFLCRHLGQMPLMTWTVRTPEQRAIATQHADQMVFENFVP